MKANTKTYQEEIKLILNDTSPLEEKSMIAKMEIAIRIEEARKKIGWTKIGLAEKLNQNPSVITKWLSGSHNFTVDTLVEIEDVLKIKLLNLEDAKLHNDVKTVYSSTKAAGFKLASSESLKSILKRTYSNRTSGLSSKYVKWTPLKVEKRA